MKYVKYINCRISYKNIKYLIELRKIQFLLKIINNNIIII